MWSIAFYIAENFVHQLREMDFVSKLFQVVAVSCVFRYCHEASTKRAVEAQRHFYWFITALTSLNILFLLFHSIVRIYMYFKMLLLIILIID